MKVVADFLGHNSIPVLRVLPFDDAVETSCFSIAWEVNVDPPMISALTLEAGLLCCTVAVWVLLLVNTYGLSGLELSLAESISFDGDV